jgi:hypothetical protein
MHVIPIWAFMILSRVKFTFNDSGCKEEGIVTWRLTFGDYLSEKLINFNKVTRKMIEQQHNSSTMQVLRVPRSGSLGTY